MKKELLGFGELKSHRCMVYDSSHLDDILAGKSSIEDIKPKFIWDSEDEDAYPFASFSVAHSNGNIVEVFLKGHARESHNALTQTAINIIRNLHSFNEKWDDREFRNRLHISLAGRLCEKSKVVILKDYVNFEDSLFMLDSELESQDIDIQCFKLLLLERNPKIEEPDWGEIYAINVNEIL